MSDQESQKPVDGSKLPPVRATGTITFPIADMLEAMVKKQQEQKPKKG